MDLNGFPDRSRDEKVTLLPQQDNYYGTFRRTVKARYLTGIVALLCLWLVYKIEYPAYCHDKAFNSQEQQRHIDDFTDITPSEQLEWHPCFDVADNLLCARLTVAMDPRRPLNASDKNPKVNIALIMKPGKHSKPEKYSRSPLLINPGGPGGSGVDIILAGMGDQIQTIVGTDVDIIGFDPRGIGSTTPRADCFAFPPGGNVGQADPENENTHVGFENRLLWILMERQLGVVNSSSIALKQIDTRARALAKLCEQKDAIYGENSILRFVSTPNVARDMVSIIDAWDDWLNLYDAAEPQIVNEIDHRPVPPTDSYSMDTRGKLVYWGFSYGTLLGATFASMFPDRVGRMVLDGVVDADAYVSPIWGESIRDADRILASLFRYCHAAEEKCAMYRKGDAVSEIQERFENAMTALEEKPLYFVINQTVQAPLDLYQSDIKQILFIGLYAPVAIFPLVAEMINAIHLRNDTLLATYGRTTLYVNSCIPKLPLGRYPTDAQKAIMCSDKRYPLNETVEDLEIIFEQMANISSFADVWMKIMISCNGWGVKSAGSPLGWDDHPVHKPQPIKTSFPLLFLSNTADPVTPLSAGLKMAQKFVDAGLVEQESAGHCSLAAVSSCTLKKVRAYFNEGKVPPAPVTGDNGSEISDGNWDKCKPNEWPWKQFTPSLDFTLDDVEEAEMMDRLKSWKEIQEQSMDWLFWGDSVIAADLMRNAARVSNI